MNTLMADIRALGRVPVLSREEGRGDEYALAGRLREAKRQDLLSESQLAELAGIAESQTRDRTAETRERVETKTRERMDTLMDDIRRLGHLPRFSQKHRQEYTVALRMREARRGGREKIINQTRMSTGMSSPSRAGRLPSSVL